MKLGIFWKRLYWLKFIGEGFSFKIKSFWIFDLISNFFKIIIIMFISSNYLFVSGEHRVHFNTNVCSRFCCTPCPFQAYGYPLLLLYLGGFGFHPSLSTGVCAIAAVYFKAISPMTQFHRFLVSLHMHDNPTALFGFLPVPCVHCCGFRDYGTPQRSTHVYNRILQASSTSANNP